MGDNGMASQDASTSCDPQQQTVPKITAWREGREWSDDIPRSFAPSAAGLFVPTDEILRAAGYKRPLRSRPKGWRVGGRYALALPKFKTSFVGCRVQNFGQFWLIQRNAGYDWYYDPPYEVLAFSLGRLLV